MIIKSALMEDEVNKNVFVHVCVHVCVRSCLCLSVCLIIRVHLTDYPQLFMCVSRICLSAFLYVYQPISICPIFLLSIPHLSKSALLINSFRCFDSTFFSNASRTKALA